MEVSPPFSVVDYRMITNFWASKYWAIQPLPPSSLGIVIFIH